VRIQAALVRSPTVCERPAVDRIYHISSLAEWDTAASEGVYRRSTRGRALEDVGFIHCSLLDQLMAVAVALFTDVDEELVVLEIDVARLTAPVRFENLEGGTILFPHIYGPLPFEAVVAVHPCERDPAGSFIVPDALAVDATGAPGETRP
jgi:uncharacterized protein (DUF952 family)